MWRFPEASRLRSAAPWLKGGRALALAGLGLGAVGYAASGGGTGPATARVTREDLVLGIEVEGELAAVRSLEIGPPVVRETWEYRITLLAPEGAQVRKGQPLVGFDATPLQAELTEKRAEHDEAAKRIERKAVELSDQRHDLELRLAEAVSRLGKARLKNDVPAELRSRNEVRETALELRDAEEAVISLKARIAAMAESHEAALRALHSRRERARARVVELEAAVDAMTVRAPQDGIVVYKGNWRGEKKKVGDSVWFGEKVLSLPDLGALWAEGTVDEADGGAVAIGQKVRLRLEALPDRDWPGKVVRIGRTVQRKSWRVPTKVFRVRIALDGADPALRPAMRFRGEIETGCIERALVVPLDAVVLARDGPAVRLKEWRGLRETPVRLGRRGQRQVEVLGGLSEGDVVARGVSARKDST